MLDTPIVLDKTVGRRWVQNDRLRLGVISELPLKICNRSFALLPSVRSKEGSSVAGVEVSPDSRETSIQESIVFGGLEQNGTLATINNSGRDGVLTVV